MLGGAACSLGGSGWEWVGVGGSRVGVGGTERALHALQVGLSALPRRERWETSMPPRSTLTRLGGIGWEKWDSHPLPSYLINTPTGGSSFL